MSFCADAWADPVLLTWSLLFQQCKVIICQMSSTRPELLHWFLFPLALVVYVAISGLLGWTEEAVLATFTALVTAAHVHYGVCVVSGTLQSSHGRAAPGRAGRWGLGTGLTLSSWGSNISGLDYSIVADW